MSTIVQTVFSSLFDWLFRPLDNLCSQLLTGAFSGLVGSMSNDEWNVAITAANRIGWIMGFVNMALCVIGALQGAAKGSVADVVKSFAMAVLAWPLTAISISTVITMDGIVGQVTKRILTVPLNGVGTSDVFGDSVVSNLIGTIVGVVKGLDLLVRIVMYIVLLIAAIALAGMLAARDISLILLACVAPLPVMMTGWKVTRPAAAKWAQAVVGVLLSAPLSALVIMVGSGICYVAKNNPNYVDSFFPALMGIATIIMACFSPKLIMPAVSFIGRNVTADMQERGGKVGPNAIKAAVQVTAGVVAAATTGGAGVLAKGAGTAAQAVQSAAKGDWSGIGKAAGGLFNKDKDSGGPPGSDEAKQPDAAGQSPSAARVPPQSESGSSRVADGASQPDSGSSRVMDAASRPDSGSERTGDGASRPDSAQSQPPAPVAAPPVQGAPGGQGGQGGEARSVGGDGGQGADGVQGSPGGDGGDGGRGGRGGDGGMGGSPQPGPYPTSHGAPSGPTVG